MEIYTTDSIPDSDGIVEKAWLVTEATNYRGVLDEALAGLKEKALQDGADAIIGLRIAVGQSESVGVRGQSFVAYGTAVKHKPTEGPWMDRR
ncbi:heavy metal-binding domain-containing protein [Streptomyces sp. NBC_01481]|uniref:heavy metal-binding domain-containing protein n=1 Tax=Streptomyces sp. NBC_01481 TaxID=2975869 RepID=UPI00225255D7|nr:heavy metal-binding domain-containing protein [Streptomyces sp. NBC_01481]MCX4581978.1 YbjQ family protein [Streptomyces sp. NBC_01481]